MTITKNKNGTWRVDISDGINPLTGIQGRHRKYDCKTKKEAIEYEAKYRLEELGEFKRKDKLSIDSLYALLKKEDVLRGNRQSTKDTQDSYYRIYVSKFFQNADMRLVKTSDIKAFRDWLVKTPSVKGGNLSASNINTIMIFVGKLFDISMMNDLRKDNPCKALKRLPQQHKEMFYYTPEQFKQFISLFDESEYHFQLLYKILMFTGARIGEALALTWEQINLEIGYIDIKNSAHYRKSKVTIAETKTTQSIRRIYIHKALIDELSKWKQRQFQLLIKYISTPEQLQIYQNTPKVLTAPDVSNFKKEKLKKRAELINLKLIRNHDFRHSHAAFLISQGLRKGEGKDYLFFTLMKRLGHSSITTTINTYSHLFPTQQKEIANAFDDF
ncbi:site-specific integrase [Lactococcus cremoris]|uniref:site-specific integrase n=1 Tax=Lactococcus lactis subsp. cremoris TaxID=1359 RepID=UPI0021AAA0D0|nr:site-specific integrase [Lactococcus cremoris]MCT4462921.1 site-specific integrase [Lactococcus cremoris]